MSEENEGRAVAVVEKADARELSIFNSSEGFELGQRMAKALVGSDMVPSSYRGNDKIGNALIALDMAKRTNSNPVMVMQNLHVIEGRPSWSSQFIIAALNSCGMFSPLRFKVEDLGEIECEYETWGDKKGERIKRKVKVKNLRCVASAVEKTTGEVLESPPVTMEMAVAEGWYAKNGSKWKTMPDLMIRYRSAAFFGRLYAPHVLMGMPTIEEVEDVPEMRDVTPPSVVEPRDAAPKKDESSAVKMPQGGESKPKANATAKEDDGDAKRGRPSAAEITAATEKGHADFKSGAPLDSCPEERPSIMAAWREGWQAASDDAKSDQKPESDDGVPFDVDDQPAAKLPEPARDDDFTFGD